MHWLSQNYQWLFDGVGVAVLGALIRWGYNRWKKSRTPAGGSQPSSALTAQGAKVTDSPVASGNNISQTINSPTLAPTIHAQIVNFGGATAPSAPPSPALAPQPKKKLLPNVQYIGAETISMRTDSYQELVEGGSEQNAIVIRFANEARPGEQNLSAWVKAVLIYRYGQKEIDVAGSWLGAASDVIVLQPDSRRHKLIAGMVIDGEFAAITGNDFVAHRRTWHRSDNHPLKGFQAGTVFVQLTDTHRSDVLYQGEFDVALNPLTITPKVTGEAAPSSCELWLEFHPSGSRALMIQNSGREPVFDVAVKIPADGSGFISDVIHRVDNDRQWMTCGSKGNLVYLEHVRSVLAEAVLKRPDAQVIPASITYRTRTQQKCECRLDIPLPLKNGIQFALPEK